MSNSTKRLLFLDMDGVIADLPDGMSYRWGEVEFWETLPRTPWADELVSLVTEKALVHILSSTRGGAASGTGKLRWLEHYYPDLVRGAILTGAKFLLAQPERVLVDDDPINIAEFIQWGGEGVLIPNPSRFPDFAVLTSIEGALQCLRELLS